VKIANKNAENIALITKELSNMKTNGKDKLDLATDNMLFMKLLMRGGDVTAIAEDIYDDDIIEKYLEKKEKLKRKILAKISVDEKSKIDERDGEEGDNED
jgi:hypothetical protein